MPRTLRLAVVAQAFAPVLGGAQRQVQALAPLLVHRGIAVSVVTRRPAGTAPRERQPSVDVIRVAVPDSRAGASAAFTLGGAWAARRLNADVIYAQDLLSSTTASMIAALAGGPPVVAKVLSTGPRGDVDRLLDKPFGARRLRAVMKRVTGFVCLSDEVERELEAFGARRETLFRVHNGVDTRVYRPAARQERLDARAALGLPDGGPVFLFCGRFATVKRVDLLVRAFSHVPGHLVLAGEGNQEPVVRRVIDELGLGERVVLSGAVSDPAWLYRAADAYVSASSTEGMSNAVLEAMASGLPIVTLPASGMVELLGGGAGLIAAEDTEMALAGLMHRVAADLPAADALGIAARERAVRAYSLEATADRLAALFAEVVDRNTHRY